MEDVSKIRSNDLIFTIYGIVGTFKGENFLTNVARKFFLVPTIHYLNFVCDTTPAPAKAYNLYLH